MINQSIIDAILKCATPTAKDLVINTILVHLDKNYDYQDRKASHILEMLVDDKAFKKPEHINMDYVNNNLNKFIYGYEQYNIKDVILEDVDNINCVAIINYKYIEKFNEDRDDIEWGSNRICINFIDTPDILKK